ncbi:hypothetical protein F4680DRAFT_30766 [Xylaria scruposa]|nr:hypothetical protein F4680DRAFT_30766 [Xylaria scruposa]
MQHISCHCVTNTTLFVSITILLSKKMGHTFSETTNLGGSCVLRYIIIIVFRVVLYLLMLPLLLPMRSTTGRTIAVLTVPSSLANGIAAMLPRGQMPSHGYQLRSSS